MTVLKSIELFFQEGTSDKVYLARIVETEPGKHDVEVEWGRRGGGLNKGKKAVGVALAAAEKTYDKLVREKTGKGYGESEITAAGEAPRLVAPPEGARLGQQGGRQAREGRSRGAAAQRGRRGGAREAPRGRRDDRPAEARRRSRVLVHVKETLLATNRAGQASARRRGGARGARPAPPRDHRRRRGRAPRGRAPVLALRRAPDRVRGRVEARVPRAMVAPPTQTSSLPSPGPSPSCSYAATKKRQARPARSRSVRPGPRASSSSTRTRPTRRAALPRAAPSSNTSS